MKKINRFLSALSLGFILGLSVPSYADDTDLYRGKVTDISQTDRPNILFVLDRSGSMISNNVRDSDGNKIAAPVLGGFRRIDHMRDALILLLREMTNVNVGLASFAGESWVKDSKHGKHNIPINFPISNIDAAVSTVAGEGKDQNVDIPIISANDDAEEGIDGADAGVVRLNDRILQLTHSNGEDDAGGTLSNYIAYYTFEDNLTDVTFNGHDGLFFRYDSTAKTATYEDSNTISNNALILPGSHRNMQIADHPDLELGSEGTIAFWYKTSNNADRTIFEKDLNGSNEMRFSTDNKSGDKIQFEWRLTDFDSELTYRTDEDDMLGQWIHVAATWNSGGATLYINGDEKDSNSSAYTLYDSDDNWYIGSKNEGSNSFAGLMDELIFAGNALTATEVAELYAQNATNSGGSGGELIIPIDSSSDDRMEYLGDGLTSWFKRTVGYDYNTSQGIWLGNGRCQTSSKCRGKTLTGLRFVDLDIPADAVIESAKIQLYLDQASDDYNRDKPLDLIITTEVGVNPETLSAGSYNFKLTPRTQSNISVEWNNPTNAGASYSDEQWINTPELNTLVTNSITQSNWTQGDNAIVFFIKLNGFTNTDTDEIGTRKIRTRNNGSSKAPKLIITWTPATTVPAGGSGGSSTPAAGLGPEQNQLVGLRFQNVNVPQKATILSAEIEFTSAENQSNTAEYTIQLENADSSQPFRAVDHDLSGRTRFADTVSWTADAWSAGQSNSSASLKDLVQQLVDKNSGSGWCGGNAMSFFIRAASTDPVRAAFSYDAVSSAAPRLRITYDPSSIPNDACVKRSASFQVSNVLGDAEQTVIRAGQADDNQIFTDGSSLRLTTTTNSDNQITKRIVGLRFKDIDIKNTADIINASLSFIAATTSDPDEASTPNFKVHAQLGSADEFEARVDNLGERNKTSQTVAWTPQNWQEDSSYSVNVTSIVKNVLENSSWNKGDNLALFIEDDGTQGSNVGVRKAYSFDGDISKAPTLVIDYAGNYADSATKVRERLLEIVTNDIGNNIINDNYTPLVPALYEATQYYRGRSVYYGDHRRKSSKNKVSHPGSYTGGALYRSSSCSDDNLSASVCASELICSNINTNGDTFNESYSRCDNLTVTEDAEYIQPTVSPCQPNFIVFLTDGDASRNHDYAIDKIKTLTGTNCPLEVNTGDGFYGSKAYNEKCGVNLAKYLNETLDLSAELVDKQNIVTHTIGFTTGVQGSNYMKAWAEAGGGQFFEAHSALSLLEAFRQILSVIKTQSASFTAPSVSINAFNKLFHNEEVYLTLFKPDNTVSWVGNVKKYKLCTGGSCQLGELLDKNNQSAIDISTSKLSSEAFGHWNDTASADGPSVTQGGVGGLLDTPDNRVIYTNAISSTNVDLTTANNALTASNSNLSNAQFDASNNDARASIINWIRGYKEGLVGADNIRDWRLGDPLHTSPGLVTYGVDDDKVFVATNDGGIRQIDAETGEEDWMFIPDDMLKIQKKLLKNVVSSNRVYGIDGSFSFYIHDINRNGIIESAQGDFVKMYIGTRRGGRLLYGLDITDPTAPKLMWKINGDTSSGFSALGQTWSKAELVKVLYAGQEKTVLMFGGGYDPSQDSVQSASTASMGNAVYMVDPNTGALLWWAGNVNSGASLELTGFDYSIPTDLAYLDNNGDGLIDRLYFGDTGGQVWRIDLGTSISSVSNRGGSLGGRLASLSNFSNVEHARRFFYPADVVRLTDHEFSNEARYDFVMITSGFRAAPIDNTIQDRFYALRDRAVNGLLPKAGISGNLGDAKLDTAGNLGDPDITPESHFITITHAADDGGADGAYDALYDATSNILQQGNVGDTDEAKIISIADEKAKIAQKHGWFIDLKTSGEKGLSSPIVLEGKVFFTTFIPPGVSDVQTIADTCSVGQGSGRIYALDILMGGAAEPFGDPSNPDDLDESNRFASVGEGIPPSPQVIFTPEGVTVMPLDKTYALPRSQVFWLQE